MSNLTLQTDLHTACRMGDLNSIKIAYQTCPSKINEKDSGVRFNIAWMMSII